MKLRKFIFSLFLSMIFLLSPVMVLAEETQMAHGTEMSCCSSNEPQTSSDHDCCHDSKSEKKSNDNKCGDCNDHACQVTSLSIKAPNIQSNFEALKSFDSYNNRISELNFNFYKTDFIYNFWHPPKIV